MADSVQRGRMLFRSAVDQFKASGVELSPEDVVALWEVARRCVGVAAQETALLEVPVQVGPVTLWPRTLGAALWWNKYGQKWYGGDKADELVALAWMLANGRGENLFETATNRAAVSARIFAWQVKVAWSLTLRDLADGVLRLFESYDVDAATGERFDAATEPDWGGVIAQLCATYHRKPEHFLWEMGERAAAELLEKQPPPPGVPRASAEAKSGFADFVAFKRRLAAKYAGSAA